MYAHLERTMTRPRYDGVSNRTTATWPDATIHILAPKYPARSLQYLVAKMCTEHAYGEQVHRLYWPVTPNNVIKTCVFENAV